MSATFKSFLLLLLVASCTAQAQNVDPSLYGMLQWRMIGPFRGGRTVGATGVVQQPNVFYMGVNNGGVWKTTDYGRTWVPIFDDQPTGSIGDVAVAPSDPGIVYAISGEGLQRPDLSEGDGVYKSIDAGATWQNMGLKEAQQLGGVAIDPKDPQRVFVAALGHPYGPNSERGVFRSTNGGKTWERVLYIDENTGAIQVTIDPKHPGTVYADMYAGRLAPWENGMWQGPGSGLYKSEDGGTNWVKLENGLPGYINGLGRIGFCISPSDPNRLYACVDAPGDGGVYRSDDAGKSWRLQSNDKRLWDRGSDFAECKVDPGNPDIVYIANVVTWKSTDGGANWTAIHGAPGGDDYHRLWINPDNSDIMLLTSDQGAQITVNGGNTWSSWYNQPTAQFYHVSTDNAFPYNVYGGQQESGSIGIASRGNDGEITFREWHSVAAQEYGYVAADPLNSNIIYGGKLSKYDKLTGQAQNIEPEAVKSGKYHFIRTAPVLFSPVDNKTLYYAGNVLFKTTTGGNSWQIISPDLTRAKWDIPECIGIYIDNKVKQMPQRGVIYTVAPSCKNINTIWAGTDDGLMHVTHNGGKTWRNITPAAISSWSKISMIDAGHSDDHTAYAAVNCIRLDDIRPYIYRTHDDGLTWQKIVKGLPDDPINTVREDPFCKGLLFAGSERAVYVSFDDGDNWQPLRLNMPATSIRDLVIKDNDLVIGTHGRSFWIMDDMVALRNIAKTKGEKKTTLYETGTAYRVRWNMNPDTPLPVEEPAGKNPPDGAIIDYYLTSNAKSPVTLEILDASGNLVRKYTSVDTLYTIPPVNIPLYWIRPQQVLPAGAGAHRFIWDLHYRPLPAPPDYPIGAVYGQTAPTPTSPWVMPGKYTVRLSVDGAVYTQPLTIKMDPRVKTSITDLKKINDLSMACYQQADSLVSALAELHSIRDRIARLQPSASALNAIDARAAILEKSSGDGTESLESLKGTFMSLLSLLQETEMPATTQEENGVRQATAAFKDLMIKWKALKADYHKL